MWPSQWKYWYSPDCTDRGWEIRDVKRKHNYQQRLSRTWEIANRRDPEEILDYIRVEGTDHMVSHLHVPNRGNCKKREG